MSSEEATKVILELMEENKNQRKRIIDLEKEVKILRDSDLAVEKLIQNLIETRDRLRLEVIEVTNKYNDVYLGLKNIKDKTK